jgi:hypothetical protein
VVALSPVLVGVVAGCEVDLYAEVKEREPPRPLNAWCELSEGSLLCLPEIYDVLAPIASETPPRAAEAVAVRVALEARRPVLVVRERTASFQESAGTPELRLELCHLVTTNHTFHAGEVGL